TLQHTLTILGALIGGGLFGLFMCGMLTTAADQRAIFCGIFCTLVFTGWTILSGNNLLPESLAVPFDLYYTGVIGNIVMFVIGYLFGKTYFKSRKSLDNLTIWTYKNS
ncbi:MAG: sodium:solute symporter, partial [Chlamydiae bacterium]